MRKRDQQKRRPVLEGLEGRLAPSSLYPGGGQQEVRHDGGAGGRDDGDRPDNGSWEPKPIGNSSTRPNVPGPTGPVRWQGDEAGDRQDHDDGNDGGDGRS